MSQLTSRDNPLKHVHLIESSRAMRSVQELKLQSSVQKVGCAVSWHDTLEELQPSPDMFTMLIAHEFFDALPIHIIQVCPLRCQLLLGLILKRLKEKRNRMARGHGWVS